MPNLWSENLSVGVPLVDAQHREIVRRAGNLIDAMREHRGLEELERLFHWLRAYVQTHFDAEERLMEQQAFPRRAAHAGEHEVLTARVSELSRRLREEGATPSVAIEANELVCAWFFEHIRGSDAELAAYLRERHGAVRAP